MGVDDSRRGVKGVGGFWIRTVLFLRMLDKEVFEGVKQASKNIDRNTLTKRSQVIRDKDNVISLEMQSEIY